MSPIQLKGYDYSQCIYVVDPKLKKKQPKKTQEPTYKSRGYGKLIGLTSLDYSIFYKQQLERNIQEIEAQPPPPPKDLKKILYSKEYGSVKRYKLLQQWMKTVITNC